MEKKSYNHIVRPVRQSDINKVLSLHNEFYKEQRTPEQWHWEYASNYPDYFVFVVSEYEGRVVGTQGMIPIYLNINQKLYLSGKSENSLVDKNYPGKNKFTFKEMYFFAMSECKSKNMCCVWGFTPLKKVWREKLLFEVYENAMYDTTLVLDLKSALSQILSSKTFTSSKSASKKSIMLFMPLFGSLYSKLFRFNVRFSKNKKNSKFKVYDKPKDINDVECLYGSLIKKYPKLIHINQDEKYLKWRIFNNPNINYKTFFVYEGNVLRAYAYFYVKEKIAYITDFTYQDNDAGAFLLRNLLSSFIKEKIGIVRFFGNSKNQLIQNTFSLMEKFGFLKRKSVLSFVLKNISYEDEKRLYNIENWYLNDLWKEGYYR